MHWGIDNCTQACSSDLMIMLLIALNRSTGRLPIIQYHNPCARGIRASGTFEIMPFLCTKRRLMVSVMLGILLFLVVKMVSNLHRTGEVIGREDLIQIFKSKSTEEWILPGNSTTLIDSPPVSAQILKALKKNAPFAVIAVMSEFESSREREAIRETWYRWCQELDIVVVFFLGRSPALDLSALSDEITKHNDIVVDSVEENYYFLSLKVLRLLKWFQRTYPDADFRPEFLVKTDHDVFINVPNLVSSLKNQVSTAHFIGGSVREGSIVVRDSAHKWYVSQDEWPEDTLPPYIAGGFYVLKADTAIAVYEEGLKVPLFVLEDVFITGLIGHGRLGVPLEALGDNDEGVCLRPASLWSVLDWFYYFQWDPVGGIAFHPASPRLMWNFYVVVQKALDLDTSLKSQLIEEVL